jgi:hypothetical protein
VESLANAVISATRRGKTFSSNRSLTPAEPTELPLPVRSAAKARAARREMVEDVVVPAGQTTV